MTKYYGGKLAYARLNPCVNSPFLLAPRERTKATHVSQLREAPFVWKSDAGIDIARRVATKNLMGNLGAEPRSQRPRKLRGFLCDFICLDV